MASSILSSLRNKSNKAAPNGGANLIAQFNQFRQQIVASGKNPQQLLNELVAQGKVTPQQLQQATKIAGQLRGKFGV